MNLQDDRPHTIDVMGRRVRQTTSFIEDEGSSASKLRTRLGWPDGEEKRRMRFRAVLKFA